jgi:hypothetical protein
MCAHVPSCAERDSPLAGTARVLVAHYEQGWCLLCNGLIRFDDGTELRTGPAPVVRPPDRERPAA